MFTSLNKVFWLFDRRSAVAAFQ